MTGVSDAGELLRGLLDVDRAPVVSALFQMEKVGRLARARERCDGSLAREGHRVHLLDCADSRRLEQHGES
eukprot:662440-Pyramimonas_sp.AAC.1